ncbi:hypothetical protein [Corynebacterium sp. p3-SID1194]|uniref:hypothetical protein n=1 Tax=Corynebacterium sp. p3-SID1194 TaxID=2916105 RepID=UPI0021A2AB35|nr:hypothetical protein [Corynebacterium sp. p3-SID1194]MCT1449641.1 hypothetical protein [Corynebacterium sp. p3-SID1194]
MADKQLTVAELMARAQKENPDAQPRRRRRRSLDEGGVSVAELTGSMKKVEVRLADVKHSSVPIDAEPAKPAKPTTPTPETEKPAPKVEKVTKVEKVAPQPTPSTPAASSVKVEPAKPAQPKPQPTPSTPAASSVKVEPAKPAQPQPQAEPKPQPQPEPKLKDPTPTSSSFKAVAPQPSKTEQTGPITQVVTLDETGEGDVDKRASLAEPSDAEVTQESPVVRDEHLPEEPVRADEVAEDYEEDASVNPILLVLLVFAGLVVGVLMFLGFQYLWESFSPILVGLLAAAVTGGVVLLVRAMKTGRDALTMTLAAIAGAAMTFGPAAVTVL